MGVGDRHSKRTAAIEKIRPAAVHAEEHDLDDPFSAWDEDDAGARKPQPGARPETTASMAAKTRVGRKLAAGTAPQPNQQDAAPHVDVRVSRTATMTRQPMTLVDPVVHREIQSRTATVDDPLTTRVLAEIARADAASEREGPVLPRTRTTLEISPDLIVTDPLDMD